MITRVVQENMDERQHRIERLDRLQQPDRRGGVDSQGLDHPGLAGLQIDRTVNVDALTHRKLLQSKAIAIDNDLRGTLRNFGLKVGMVGKVKFEARIKE